MPGAAWFSSWINVSMTWSTPVHWTVPKIPWASCVTSSAGVLHGQGGGGCCRESQFGYVLDNYATTAASDAHSNMSRPLRCC